MPGPARGDRFAIYVKEKEIKKDYDSYKYLENKLNDTSLSYYEYSKIYEDKKLLYPSSDLIKRGINVGEMLLKIGNDN